MTEQEWLGCTDPKPMLVFLEGKVSDRKLRLFVCACCRRVWRLLKPASRNAVEIAERYADGLAKEKELMAAWTPADDAARFAKGGPRYAGFAACALIGYPVKWTHASQACADAAQAVGRPRDRNADTDPKKAADEQLVQAALLRHIIGNPFRPIPLAPAWLTWQGCLVVSMAQRMYDSRDFTDMPVLADALEEAGCQDPDILSHCRQPGEHARGCWVVDLLLGKS